MINVWPVCSARIKHILHFAIYLFILSVVFHFQDSAFKCFIHHTCNSMITLGMTSMFQRTWKKIYITYSTLYRPSKKIGSQERAKVDDKAFYHLQSLYLTQLRECWKWIINVKFEWWTIYKNHLGNSSSKFQWIFIEEFNFYIYSNIISNGNSEKKSESNFLMLSTSIGKRKLNNLKARYKIFKGSK